MAYEFIVSHSEEIKFFFVHSGKAVVYHSHTMCSKMTSLNLFENINTLPLKKIKVKMICMLPIILFRRVCDFANCLDIFCGACTFYILILLLLIDFVCLTAFWQRVVK